MLAPTKGVKYEADTVADIVAMSDKLLATGCPLVRLACRWRLTGGTLARQRLNFPRSRRGARASASHRRDRGAACC